MQSDRFRQRLPLGGAVAQRLRGFKSAEPEKTVKRSSRRTGVNLQFFPVEPTALGLKGACSPFFVDPARRNRWHFSGSLLVSKENIPRLPPHPPAERPCTLAASKNFPCKTRTFLVLFWCQKRTTPPLFPHTEPLEHLFDDGFRGILAGQFAQGVQRVIHAD